MLSSPTIKSGKESLHFRGIESENCIILSQVVVPGHICGLILVTRSDLQSGKESMNYREIETEPSCGARETQGIFVVYMYNPTLLL